MELSLLLPFKSMSTLTSSAENMNKNSSHTFQMDPIWERANSYEDLIILNFLFLRGIVSCTPNHGGPIDEETIPLVGNLIKINKKGFLTTQGQPGLIETFPAPNSFEIEKKNKTLIKNKTKPLPRLCESQQRPYLEGLIPKGWKDIFIDELVSKGYIVSTQEEPYKEGENEGEEEILNSDDATLGFYGIEDLNELPTRGEGEEIEMYYPLTRVRCFNKEEASKGNYGEWVNETNFPLTYNDDNVIGNFTQRLQPYLYNNTILITIIGKSFGPGRLEEDVLQILNKHNLDINIYE